MQNHLQSQRYFKTAPINSQSPRFRSFPGAGRYDFLSEISRIICSFKKIINGYVKIISKPDKCCIIRFPFSGFISAYGILIDIQVKCKFELRDTAFFPQFFQFHGSVLCSFGRSRIKY